MNDAEIDARLKENSLEARRILLKLRIWERFWYRLGFKLKVGKRMYHGWKASMMHYLFKCPLCHRPGIDYPHGYRNRLDCPHCALERRAATT
jgi:hypothetical protein